MAALLTQIQAQYLYRNKDGNSVSLFYLFIIIILMNIMLIIELGTNCTFKTIKCI